jgi:tetratricopeptide (TPR) repeat protein
MLQKAIAARDDVPQLYAFYVSILDEEHQYQKGASLLETALKKFPDNTQLRFYLGSMYDRLGRTDETIAEMRKILVLDSDHVQALNYLAYTFAEQGKNLAEAMSRKAMTLQPNDPFILDTVGWVLFKEGRIEDAIQYLETAFRYKSDESVIAEHLGDAYYVFELTDKAKEMYRKAAASENDPEKATKIRAKIMSVDARPHDRRPASADQSPAAKP